MADELNLGGFVRVLFLEVHYEPKGTILKGSVGRTDDDGVPEVRRLASSGDVSLSS